MKRLTLERYAYLPECTLGVLSVHGFKFYTIERPWLNNTPFSSCVPEGFYTVAPYSSKRFRDVYEVEHVEGRTHILIHAGNVVADVAGCVAVGSGRRTHKGEHWVTQSRLALMQLRSALGKESAYLDVVSKRATL